MQNIALKNNFNFAHQRVVDRIQSEQIISAQKANKLTIADLVTIVAKRVKESTLCDEFFDHNKALLAALSSKMHLSVFQAVLVSVILDTDDGLHFSSLARYMDCGVMTIRKYQPEIDDLVKRHIITIKSGNYREIEVTPKAIYAYCHNMSYDYEVPTNLTVEQLFREVRTMIEDHCKELEDCDCGSNGRSYELLWDNIKELLEHNRQHSFVMNFLNSNDLPIRGKMVLLLMAVELFLSNHVFVTEELFKDTFLYEGGVNGYNNGQMVLYNLDVKGYLDHQCMDGLDDLSHFCLSEKSCSTFFAGLNLQKYIKDYFYDGLVETTDWPKKSLFYNAEDEAQVAQLYSLLNEENFKKICDRLESEGLRKGFACLFYGAPGCGKTETVYQIAKATGRSVVVVEVNSIMSKWVGDSEKNIKQLFLDYKDKVRHLDKAPILLFNEADSIIHKRHTVVDHAVDQMSNSIQNIILQEMESLEGIMIATTNLTENLDKAFDRRFIYKIEFHKPGQSVKSKIWSAMVPALSVEQADALAQEFDLTGGEIENVVRKSKVNYILTGIECDFEALQSICRKEIIKVGGESNMKKVGF